MIGRMTDPNTPGPQDDPNTNPGADDPGQAPPPATPGPAAGQPDPMQPPVYDPTQNPYGGAYPTGPYGAATVTAPANPELGAGFKWAWDRFSKHVGTFIGAALLWLLVFIAAGAVLTMILFASVLGTMDLDSTSPSTTLDTVSIGALVTTTLITIVVLGLVGALALSCWLNGLITVTDGRPVGVADFFRPIAFWPILLVSLIVGIISSIVQIPFGTDTSTGTQLLSTLVSLVLSFFTIWMVYFAADLKLGVGQSLSEGFKLSLARPGPTVVVLLVSVLLAILGVIPGLVIGLLVTLPLSGLLTMYYFRSLTGRQIAAV